MRITGVNGRKLNGIFVRDFTEAEIEGRKQVSKYARFFRDHLQKAENGAGSTTPGYR